MQFLRVVMAAAARRNMTERWFYGSEPCSTFCSSRAKKIKI